LLGVLVILTGAYFHFLKPETNVFVLNWVTYSGSDSGINGYLYELSNSLFDNNVYISSDKEITVENLNLAEGWEIKLLSQGELWNPRVCAKMPLVLTFDGDVFMYETERKAAGSFLSKIIWFNNVDGTIKEVSLNPSRFVGSNLFRDEQMLPYFFSKEEQTVKKNTIFVKENLIKSQIILELSNHESLTLGLESRNEPVLKVYDEEKFDNQFYTLENSTLRSFDKALNYSSTHTVDETYVVHDIENEFEAKYRPGGPYETSVLYQGKPVASFVPEMKVYSYIIGSY
jgi:hypothetical protein